MKYILTFEAKKPKKHKYKVGDWILLNIEEHNYINTGEIVDLDRLVGRPEDNDLCYTVNIFCELPEELSYMEGDCFNSNICVVEEGEIERRLNKKEKERAIIKKNTDKYNL